MNEPWKYPPPDFGCPPQNSIQHQQPPRSSSFHPNMWSWGGDETPPWKYPPPDFGCPPQNSIQHQQPTRSSSFHPSMWSWSGDETPPSEPSWHHGGQAGFPPPPGRGNYGPKRPYGQNFGYERHQGGRRGGRQNYGQPNNHGRKQKNEKEPEYSHFCDTCDRGFKTQEKYDEHVSQHVKCSVPDCSFTANEKFVSIHWKNTHAPGAKRIKLDTPDEIVRWREQRRKNYPTLQNVEKKRKAMELREETGAVLETAQFGRMRGRNRGRGRGRGRGNRGFHGRHPQGPHPSHSSAPEMPPPLSQRCNDGDPLGALASSDHDSDREDPAAESRLGGLAVPPKQLSSALCSLMASYGSMSESDDEPEATPIQRAKDLVRENQPLLNPMPPNAQGRTPSSQSRGAHNVSPSVSVPHTPHTKRGRAGRRRTRRPTLLEMLLAPDIRHERNVLLQCVRYVVRNNFFGLESGPQKQEGVEDGTAPAIPAEGLEERKEEQCEEDEDERSSVGVDNQEDLETNTSVLVERSGQDQGLQSHQVCSEPSEDPVGNKAAGDLIHNGEETVAKDRHSSESTHTDKITRTLTVYDDEIW